MAARAVNSRAVCPIFAPLALIAWGLLACEAPAPGAPPPASADARPDAGPGKPPAPPVPFDAGAPPDRASAPPDSAAPAPVVDSAPAGDPSPPPPPPAVDPAACTVDPARVFADVRQLAAPEFRGRKPGDVGNQMAIEFAEKQFRAAGLVPAADGASFRQAFEFRPGAKADNLLGVIKGSDPVLGKEVVIVGAHIDHLGVNRDGAINYGADDNASGAAVVIELGRLFKLCNVIPKRTILFIEFNAEEMGLIGSRAYVAQPAYPLANTKAAYIFDMVGAGDGTGTLVFGGNDPANRWITQLMRATTAAAKLPYTIQVVPQKLASDHAPFVEKHVPSVFAFSRPDPHPGYHTPADDIDNVSLASLQAIGEIYWATLRSLALGEEAALLTAAP